ncbi:alpha/beta hydrolase [Thermoactinospora rubra]|uniref:alpha/beta hydrolase n=1 Tax=Thermoactinospora rubra TaxID=1088767 RepID=UPI000A10EDE0|nr:alpha/beta hydrolase [Thermoactinospora rubra]
MTPSRRGHAPSWARRALAAGGVLLGLLAAGCAAGGHTDSRPSSVPADAGALRPFYEQKITWKACDDGFECGRIRVPLDYADPGGETITVAVNRKRAADQSRRIGSLLLNPGGPGGSGLDLAQDSGSILTERLRARFDVVGFDPRGVGRSAAISCRSSTGGNVYVPTASNPRASAEPTASDYVKHFKEFATHCRAGSGRLLGHVSTAEVARDMDILRGVLGDAKLHYLGYSYGTFLGASYAEQFPGRVGRLVLDSAVDPREWPTGGLRAQAVGRELALDSFVADCAKRPDCPLGTEPKAAKRSLAELLERLDRTPLPGDGADRLDKRTAIAVIGAALYDKKSWPAMRTGFKEAMAGDGAALLDLGGSGDGESNFAEAFTANFCLDGPPRVTTVAQAQALQPELGKVAPIFGEETAWFDLQCAYWPVKPVGKPHTITAPGAAPILVVGVTKDPATPYRWAQGLAGQLSSGVLLAYDGDGHGAYGMDGSACVNDAVDTYLIDGRPPADGKRCR